MPSRESPLVGFGVSETVEEPAQQGGCVEVAARAGSAGLGGCSGNVLGRPDQKFSCRCCAELAQCAVLAVREALQDCIQQRHRLGRLPVSADDLITSALPITSNLLVHFATLKPLSLSNSGIAALIAEARILTDHGNVSPVKDFHCFGHSHTEISRSKASHAHFMAQDNLTGKGRISQGKGHTYGRRG